MNNKCKSSNDTTTSDRMVIEDDINIVESHIGKHCNLLRVSTENNDKEYAGLSPISEIVLDLNDTNIGTPRRSDNNSYRDFVFGDATRTVNSMTITIRSAESKRNFTMTGHNNFGSQSAEKILISNNFTINTTTSSGGNNRSLSAARRLAARNVQRRLNIEPNIINFGEDAQHSLSPNNNNNNMSIDDISFYDETTPATSSASRSLFNDNNSSNTATSIDDDDETAGGLLSLESSPQRFIVRKNVITILDKRQLLDENDGSSSGDSGYGTTLFKFAEPKLPKRQPANMSLEPSPHKFASSATSISGHQRQTITINHPQQLINETSPKNFRIFNSLSSGSMESMDDEYMTDLIEMESLDEDAHFPSDLNSLISGHIKTTRTTPEIKRPAVRRCLSLNENTQMNRVRGSLFNQQHQQRQQSPKTPEILKSVCELNLSPYISNQITDEQRCCFKRPEPPAFSPIQSKRHKTESLLNGKENTDLTSNLIQQSQQLQLQQQRQRPVFRKSVSMNDAQIMTALAKSSSNFIGDFSKPFCLPVMDGRHCDLKSISCETVAKLIRGEFRNEVASYKIIDCRYPYEFDGGHIGGAQNLYTHEQILDELVKCKTEAPAVQPDGPKRHILIFHCEFSSERGPKLSRFLRNHDRLQNSDKYPALYYPEMYLLHNGYKEFYENFSQLCEPIAYRPMLEPSFGELYRQFRAKSKSWSGDIKTPCTKFGLKKSRSRLVL